MPMKFLISDRHKELWAKIIVVRTTRNNSCFTRKPYLNIDGNKFIIKYVYPIRVRRHENKFK